MNATNIVAQTEKKASVLITGGGGFFGGEITKVLANSGWDISTLGRNAANDIQCDLSLEIPEFKKNYKVVVHNAGKAHMVPKTAADRKSFEDINVKGTRNLISGLERMAVKPESLIFISSIAVYGLEKGYQITEDHPLKATDPYGLSKINAELELQKWASAHSVALTILRLPLLVGKNPPGNLGAMIKGIRKGLYFSIDGGKARKSMVLTEDVASLIPSLVKNTGIFNLTDGFHPSFRELESLIATQARVRHPFNIPLWVARILGLCGDIIDSIIPGKFPVTTRKIKKLTSTLIFDDQRARQQLNWNPKQVTKTFQVE